MKFKFLGLILLILFMTTFSCSKKKITVYAAPKILYFFDSETVYPVYREPGTLKRMGELNPSNFHKINFLSVSEIETKNGNYLFYQVSCLKEWNCDGGKGYLFLSLIHPLSEFNFEKSLDDSDVSSNYLIDLKEFEASLDTFQFLEKKSKKFPEQGLSQKFLKFWINHPSNFKKVIDLYGFFLYQKQLPIGRKLENYNLRTDSYLSFFGLIREVKLVISEKEIQFIKNRLDKIYNLEMEDFFNQEINFNSISQKFNSISLPYLQEKILEEFLKKGSFEVKGRSYNLLGNSNSAIKYANWKFIIAHPDEVSFSEELEGLEKKQIYIISINAASTTSNLNFQIETSEGQIDLKSIEITNAFGFAKKIAQLKKELPNDYKKILEDNSNNHLLALAVKFGTGDYNLQTEAYEYEINDFNIIYAYFQTRPYVNHEKDYSGSLSLNSIGTFTWYIDYNKKTKIRAIVFNHNRKDYGRDGAGPDINNKYRCFENEPLKFSFKPGKEILNNRSIMINRGKTNCEDMYFGISMYETDKEIEVD